MISFIGESSIALAHAVVGRARFRRVDLLLNIQEAGANALGIVSLISFLIGLILAFVGAIQLRQFGAQIYIADLVAIGMAREMGAMMAAIIMAGARERPSRPSSGPCGSTRRSTPSPPWASRPSSFSCCRECSASS
jgi:ABC-type transporter Mla maintaining outer membrane lipid asymmetry permease subunit MlaE